MLLWTLLCMWRVKCLIILWVKFSLCCLCILLYLIEQRRKRSSWSLICVIKKAPTLSSIHCVTLESLHNSLCGLPACNNGAIVVPIIIAMIIEWVDTCTCLEYCLSCTRIFPCLRLLHPQIHSTADWKYSEEKGIVLNMDRIFSFHSLNNTTIYIAFTLS